MAKEEGVAFFESPVLARALYFTTEVGAFIPETLYEAVAKVIAYIFNINAINRDSGNHRAPSSTCLMILYLTRMVRDPKYLMGSLLNASSLRLQ